MAAVNSTMMALGTDAPNFSLPDYNGNTVSREDFKDAKGLVVMFLCNHCPYVIHVKDEIARLHAEYGDRGVAFVAINPNDANQYPDDSPENMRLRAEEWAWRFPYLHDDSQEAAKAFRAACTPEFYVFNEDRRLAYRGQLDSSRPGNSTPVNGADLRHALEAMLEGEMPDEDQTPSIGCSIKWKPGNVPEYMLGVL